MKNTNYRKWAFKFLIYVVLLNILVAYMVANAAVSTNVVITLDGFETPKNTSIQYVGFLSLLGNVLFIAGIVLTILSVKSKEEKDYKYKVSIWGYPIFLIVTLILLLTSF